MGLVNPQALPPENQWYRPPVLWEAPAVTDSRLFIWFAEVLPRQVPIGVAFRVTPMLSVMLPFDVIAVLSAAAKGELYRRVDANFFSPPAGSLINLFSWTPVVIRDARGVITIGNGQVTDVQVNADNSVVIVNPRIGVVPLPVPTPQRLMVEKGTTDAS